MKITKSQLKEIIKEELEAVLEEGGPEVYAGEIPRRGRELSSFDKKRVESHKNRYKFQKKTEEELRAMQKVETDPLKRAAIAELMAELSFGF